METSLGLNMASVIAANSFYIGGNWGFVLEENEDFERIYNILAEDSNVKILNVSNGIIVFCNPKYLYQMISQVDNIDETILEKQNTRLKSEVIEFQKFLTNVVHEKSKYGIIGEGYIEYNIGLYSCNNLHKIRLNGKEYPAYNLTVVEACKEILKITKLKEVYVSVSDGFENILKIQNNNLLNDIISNLEISNTLTGAFLTIRVVRGN